MRTIADGVKPSEYGRREAFRVHQALKEQGPVTVPREFVFMDRAAIGLGGVFLHLEAELNFHRPVRGGNRRLHPVETVTAQQRKALAAAGLKAELAEKLRPFGFNVQKSVRGSRSENILRLNRFTSPEPSLEGARSPACVFMRQAMAEKRSVADLTAGSLTRLSGTIFVVQDQIMADHARSADIRHG